MGFELKKLSGSGRIDKLRSELFASLSGQLRRQTHTHIRGRKLVSTFRGVLSNREHNSLIMNEIIALRRQESVLDIGRDASKRL